jgi:ABC-type transporter Mla subunit MlaD
MPPKPKRKLTKKKATALEVFKKKAKAIVADLAKKRDELTDLMAEYEDVVNTVDQGIEDAESAMDSLERAVEEMSQHL